ncbi:MAG TPA: ribonuclease D [Thermoanaerobaculia bacterium]|nr:ribonuclease D [Thermoanaerobaculia bacterium]
MKWIDQQDPLDALIDRIAGEKVIAIDTEADSLHSYFDKVCLIQLSTPTEDFVIDPLAKVDLGRFGAVLGDPEIRKIFHGADYDLRILNRDFGFVCRNLVDTMICSQLLGFEAIGLAALLKKYFDANADKSHQRADWAMRPLTAAMLEYASMDTRYLIRLAAKLEEELRARERWPWAQEEFSRLEAIRYRPSERDEDAFRKVKGIGRVERRGLAAIKALFEWRDSEARRLDRPAFKVMLNETLLDVARDMPETPADLKRIKGLAREQGRKASEVLAVIQRVRALSEDELPQQVEGKAWKRDRALEKRVERLKKVRDITAGDLGLDGGILAPKHVLTAIATNFPRSTAELEAVPAMREWQKELLAEKLIAALNVEEGE